MGEHDSQRRVGGPDLANRKVDTVGRGHPVAAVAVESLEVLVRKRILDHRTPVEHRANHGRPGNCAYRTNPGRTGQPASPDRTTDMESIEVIVAQRFSAPR